MAGHRSFKELFGKMSPEAQLRAQKGATAALAALELAELREKAEVTQAEMAKRLNTLQGAVSRFERQRDWKLSSLVDYVGALGGKLEVRALFGDRAITISHLVGAQKKTKRVAAR